MFQTSRLKETSGRELGATYEAACRGHVNVLAFELGPMFAPNGEILESEAFERLMDIPEIVGMGPTKTTTGGNSPADQLKRASQEEAYWTSKEGAAAAAAAAAAASAKPGQANPEPIQRPVQPPLDPSEIRRRQRELERAEWRPAPDSPLGGEMSPGMMARVSPDQLPSLLRASGRDSATSDESGSDVSSSSRLTQSYELGQGSVPSLQDPMTGSSREDMGRFS